MLSQFRTIALIAVIAGSAFGQQQPLATNYILNTDPAELNEVLANHNLALTEVVRDGIYRVAAPPGTPTNQLAKSMEEDPDVTGFETDSEVPVPEAKPSMQPSIAELAGAIADRATTNYYGSAVRDSYVNQTATSLIELPAALSQFGAGSDIVAVIDTGIDPGHPAFAGSLIPGYDFTRNVAGYASEMADLDQSTVAILEQSTVAILEGEYAPAILNQSTVAILEQSTVAILEGSQLPEDFGHGTMVAGLIHLVAPNARIMPLKAFRADGTSNLSDVIRAIYYAVDHGASVINMSFATTSASADLEAAIAYAKSKKVILVASAGNDGKCETVYPAALRGVIGVGSTTSSDKRSKFSNYGDGVARTSAPGEALVTTYPGGNYAGVWGTSFSSALVSGAAVLMLQKVPSAGYSSISDALERGKPVDLDMGDARLDVLKSLIALQVDN